MVTIRDVKDAHARLELLRIQRPEFSEKATRLFREIPHQLGQDLGDPKLTNIPPDETVISVKAAEKLGDFLEFVSSISKNGH